MPDRFQFYFKSSDSFPGKGTGEVLESPKDKYHELSLMTGWRRILSNGGDTPFSWKGHTWRTAEHAYRASIYELKYPTYFQQFSLDSESELATGDINESLLKTFPKLSKAELSEWKLISAAILNKILVHKYSKNEKAKRALLATGDAELWTFIPPGKAERWLFLELLRSEIVLPKRNVRRNVDMSESRTKVTKSKKNSPKVASAAPVSLEEGESSAVTSNFKNAVSLGEQAVAATAARNNAASPPLRMDDDVNEWYAQELARNPALANSSSSSPPLVIGEGAEKWYALEKEREYEASVEKMRDSSIRFCAVCSNYLYLHVDETTGDLQRSCRNCGYKDTAEQGGLVSEMRIEQLTAEGYNLINEFTLRDPRLPHLTGTLKCINGVCASNTEGRESDIVYIKYDYENLRYMYICTQCKTSWRSRR
jgi:DNA-directed RNA polymerase subunit M/transcription elongation factor TFIIS